MCSVVLINPPCDCLEDDRLEPQLGLLYIASLLKENDIPVQVYEMTGCTTADQIKVKIENIPGGDIYGFTTYCTNYPYVKQCINYIRRRGKNAFIVLGGPNPTALPGFTVKDSQCDCVITGEGEDAFLSVANARRNHGKVPKIIKGGSRPDIDTYPTPAWDLIDFNSYTRTLEGERVVSMISSRGCRYKCVHCNSVVMGGGNKLRYREPGNILKEMHFLKTRGFNKFRFNDDNFTGNPNLTELLTGISKLDTSYRIFARVEDLTEDNCRLLKESGCCHISVGLETLNPDNLEILGKYSQAGLEQKQLENTNKYGITVRVYFMIGLPFDNDETVTKYFETASQLPFQEYSLYPLIPYPGTEIWRNPGKFGYKIVDSDFTHYVQIGKGRRTCFALAHQNFPVEKVNQWFNLVTGLMYRAGKQHIKESSVAR